MGDRVSAQECERNGGASRVVVRVEWIIILLQELLRASLPVGSPRHWCHHEAVPRYAFASKRSEVQQDIGCAAEQGRQHEAQQEEDPPPSMSLVHIHSYGLLWLHLRISMAFYGTPFPCVLLQTHKATACFLQQLFISVRSTNISDSLPTTSDTMMIVSDKHL